MSRHHMSLPVVLGLFALIASTAPAQAVVFSNFGVGDTYNIGNAAGVFGSNSIAGQTIRRAASFIPAANAPLVDAQVAISSQTASPNILLSIVADNAGSPTGATLRSSVRSGITTRNIYTFSFTGNVPLIAGNRYWIVMEPLDPSGTLNMSWFYNNTGNLNFSSRFANGSWQAANGIATMAYRINGTVVVVPETGTLALLGVGCSALGVVVLRRRRAA